MQTNRQNLKWLGRTALILVLVAAANGLFVAFARKPLPWAAMIPGLIPLLIAVFVIIPVLRSEQPAPPTA